MASKAAPKQSKPPNKRRAIDNYDIDSDDDPFASSADERRQRRDNTDKDKQPRSKKRKDVTGLGIDEEVSVTKKPRAPNVKLDEARLLSDKGIPRLRRKARDLKFKGKGHEFSDAARLLSFYQLWLDDLFPKAKFLDALAMVEKAGHKKFMRIKRLEWIDEGKPRSTALADDDDDIFGGGRAGGETDANMACEPARFPARVAPLFSQNRPTTTLSERPKTPLANDDEDVFGDLGDIYGVSPRPARTGRADAASTGSLVPGVDENADRHREDDGGPDEDELAALMAEEEEEEKEREIRNPRPGSKSLFGNGSTSIYTAPPHPHLRDSGLEEEEDDLDAMMAEAESHSTFLQQSNKNPSPSSSLSSSNAAVVSKEQHQQQPPPLRTSKAAVTANDKDDEEDDDLDALIAEAEEHYGVPKRQMREEEEEADSNNNNNNDKKATHGTRDMTFDDDDEEAMAEMDGLW